MDETIQRLARRWAQTGDVHDGCLLVQAEIRRGQSNVDQIIETYDLPPAPIWDCICEQDLTHTSRVIAELDRQIRGHTLQVLDFERRIRYEYVPESESRNIIQANYFTASWQVVYDPPGVRQPAFRFHVWYEHEPHFPWKVVPNIFASGVPHAIGGVAGPTNRVEVRDVAQAIPAVSILFNFIRAITTGILPVREGPYWHLDSQIFENMGATPFPHPLANHWNVWREGPSGHWTVEEN